MSVISAGPRAAAEARDAQLLTAQLDLLAAVAAGDPIGEALDALLRVVEQVSGAGLLASVLLIDEEGRHLVHGAAPSLPDNYCKAIDGIEIGPVVGSCGTAAYYRRQVIVEDIAHDPLWANFKHLALAAGLHACWSTPIFGMGGRLLGTFALYYPVPLAPTPGDRALIDVLVRSVSLALERSRRDAQKERELAAERSLALTFQRSLLPQVPARIGPVELAARYRTGDPGVRVGGDWFDAIEVEEGLVLVVGDVQGHDVEAAALMGQLRTVVRTTAFEGHSPSGVLAQAADYLGRLETDLLATALVVHVDVGARLLTAACAGHLPPTVLTSSAEGTAATPLSVKTGPPLGVGHEWEERSTQLAEDALLLLYTDGLVESRAWDIDEGMGLLHGLLESLPRGAGPAEVLGAALELIPAGSRGDDVAVLAARIPATGGELSQSVERSLPAQAMSVPVARWWARDWLEASGVREDVVDSALVVVSEMVSNAARQEAGSIRLRLELAEGSLWVEVFDGGRRMPRLVDFGPEATEGRGLQLVDSLAEAWGVQEELHGKTVWARIPR